MTATVVRWRLDRKKETRTNRRGAHTDRKPEVWEGDPRKVGKKKNTGVLWRRRQKKEEKYHSPPPLLAVKARKLLPLH